MIRIIRDENHYDDDGTITAIDIKFKSLREDGKEVADPALVSKIMSAISKTTLLADEENRGFKIIPDKKRKNIVADLTIKLGRNSLTRTDIANFIDALEKAINEVKLF